MPMNGAWISEEEYLAAELISDIRHEYMDGAIYAMAEASRNHEKIVGTLYCQLRNHLHATASETFASNLKIKIGNKFFYPDAMVVCDEQTANDYYTEAPTLIVEVLSKSSRRMDETTKRNAYQSLPSLQEYVLIEQDFVDVEVCRKSAGWVSQHYFWGDTVDFEAIGLTLTVAEIYERVDNDEVRGLLAAE